jgi:two-component system, LytTR family, response regulator LytT
MKSQLQSNDVGFTNQQLLETNYTRKPFFGIGKKSFLVFHRNRYITVPTESIAFFYIKYEATVLVTFDKHEYTVNYSLEQIQQLLSEQQFFRLNRQYLINFSAIKEVEHYFARKLLVVPTITFSDKLIVSKEKARSFLEWLENR